MGVDSTVSRCEIGMPALVGAFSVIVKTDGSFAALVVSRPSNVKGHTTQREEKHGTINCLWDLLSPICHHQQWGGRTGRGAPPILGFLWGWDKLYWVYVYVVRRWMLGFYIPLFYGDCTTQSLQSGFSQQIHISDLISSYFYLKLTQMLPFHHRLFGHDQENWG